MSEICDYCGVCSRNPCSRYTGSNRFDGCYNLSREQQLLALSAEGDTSAQEILELMRENEELRGRR
jgi:hypothetical protein